MRLSQEALMIIRVSPAAFLILLASSTPVLAQNVVFEEGFQSGIPATWTNIHSGSSSDVWMAGYGAVNGSPDIRHEFYCNHGSAWRDNNLVSPPIDLRGLTRATFTCEQFQQYPLSINYNAVEVSTDGGQTFTVLHQLIAPPAGYSVINVDMDAYAGLPSVQIGLHYRGYVANDWNVDNVRVLTANPLYSIQNLVAGSTATLQVRGAGAGHTVLLGVSFAGAGPVTTPFGAVNMSRPIVRLPIQVADANGEVSLGLRVPAGFTGRTIWSQAIEIWSGGGGEPSNSLVQVVQ
jgi:hypothetical protein